MKILFKLFAGAAAIEACEDGIHAHEGEFKIDRGFFGRNFLSKIENFPKYSKIFFRWKILNSYFRPIATCITNVPMGTDTQINLAPKEHF